MKKIWLLLFVPILSIHVLAQDNVNVLQENARDLMKKGDYATAITTLNKAIVIEPTNLSLSKDLVQAYYQKSDYPLALNIANKLMDRADADPAVFQLAGMIAKATGDAKEADKVYSKGLKLFPKSGALYNDAGELLWSKKDATAIRYWEKGIEVDPNYSRNYYNAARYYALTADKVWSILYAEIFINIESYTQRTAEIKALLLESYKKLFADATLNKTQDTKNAFVAAYLSSMSKQSSVAINGITAESLTMIRSRFLLDWFEKNNARFPFKLFEYQKQLAKEGTFEAYNQWLFQSTQNLTAFQRWSEVHIQEYNLLMINMRNRLFKLPATNVQYYQTPYVWSK
jgi:tetratricopeptide (TPR) repeat protein